MILLLSLIAGGTTLIVDPTHPDAATKSAETKPFRAAPDIEVQIAQAPAGVALPLAVKSAVWTDASGKVVRCQPTLNAGPAFGSAACKQVEALPPFPVQYDEYNRPIAAVRSITVSFNTAH